MPGSDDGAKSAWPTSVNPGQSGVPAGQVTGDRHCNSIGRVVALAIISPGAEGMSGRQGIGCVSRSRAESMARPMRKGTPCLGRSSKSAASGLARKRSRSSMRFTLRWWLPSGFLPKTGMCAFRCTSRIVLRTRRRWPNLSTRRWCRWTALPGRSAEAKRQLYGEIVDRLEPLGIPRDHVLDHPSRKPCRKLGHSGWPGCV